MADKKERQQYLKFREMANDLRKAEHWDELDGVLNRNKTVQNLYKMGYRKLSADVVEVKHGEWDNNGEFYQCSDCSNFTNYNYDYCPKCGAKMDGGKEE